MHDCKSDLQFRFVASVVLAYWSDVLDEGAFATYFESTYVDSHWGHWYVNAPRDFDFEADEDGEVPDDMDCDDTDAVLAQRREEARLKIISMIVPRDSSAPVSGAPALSSPDDRATNQGAIKAVH